MDEKDNKNIVVTFRVLQALCMGVFALGLSMGLGDLAKYYALPFSSISITTTVFGFIGSMITGIFANKAAKW
jgi:hypothetical protein